MPRIFAAGFGPVEDVDLRSTCPVWAPVGTQTAGVPALRAS